MIVRKREIDNESIVYFQFMDRSVMQHSSKFCQIHFVLVQAEYLVQTSHSIAVNLNNIFRNINELIH
jgi:hypothetical protein